MKKLLLIGLWMLLPSSLFADDIRYSFVDISLGVGEGEIGPGEDVDLVKFAVNGSWGLGNNIALFASSSATVFDNFENDDDCCDLTLSEQSAGINPHFSLGGKVDIVIPIAFLRQEYENDFGESDDTGYSVGVGIRALVSSRWELAAEIRRVDIFEITDETVTGSVRWHINDLFSLAFGAEANDLDEAVTLAGRFSF